MLQIAILGGGLASTAALQKARFQAGTVRGVNRYARHLLVARPDGQQAGLAGMACGLPHQAPGDGPRVRVALDWLLDLVLPPDIGQLPIMTAPDDVPTSVERASRPPLCGEPQKPPHTR